MKRENLLQLPSSKAFVVKIYYFVNWDKLVTSNRAVSFEKKVEKSIIKILLSKRIKSKR